MEMKKEEEKKEEKKIKEIFIHIAIGCNSLKKSTKVSKVVGRRCSVCRRR